MHLRTFSHETEDLEKVRLAIRHVALGGVSANPADKPRPSGRGGGSDVTLEESHLDGSHKNKIIIVEATVKSAQGERMLFDQLARDDPRAFARVVHQAPQRLDENLNFFLRFDKQEAYLGRIVLAEGEDAITFRGKLRTFPKGDDVRERAERDLAVFLSERSPARPTELS